jgi:phage terminase large subunit-like protein
LNAALDISSMLAELDPKDITLLPRDRQERFAEILATIVRRKSQRQFFDLFPDNDNTGPDGRVIYARARYPKHMEFIKATATYRECCFMAGNRVGKTTVAAYITTSCLTGVYPNWWDGRRFDVPISAWACGKKNETTRDIVQHALLGEVTYDTADGRKGFKGTGMIPGHLIGRITWKRGVDDLVDTAYIRHTSDRWSRLSFKAYEQGRGAFEGTARHLIWADEEIPEDIYGECLIRTATTGGIILLTYTPLEGLSDVTRKFMLGMDE